jgi:hypothetical protein
MMCNTAAHLAQTCGLAIAVAIHFRSHPLPSEHLDQANRIIAQQHWEDRKTQKPFRVEYEVHNGEFVK